MIHVIGAGSAGASLAYFLKDEFNVKIYEMKSDLGLKPCAWGVPKEIEEYIKIPKRVILNNIYKYKIYLDGELLVERSSKSPLGYIIDKREFLKWLLEGVDVEFSKYIRFRNRKPILNVRSDDIVVIATGYLFHRDRTWRMLTVQYTLSDINIDSTVMEMWFSSDIVGYLWIFPKGKKEAKVGICGFLTYFELISRLNEFIKDHPQLKTGVIKKRETSYIYVGGINEELYNLDYYVIGEALGTVFPITGEGIRPSVISAYALARALKHATSFREEFEKTQIPQQISLQKQAVEILLKSDPNRRRSLLKILFSD